ncbi:uncharacterized protein LOC111276700 isoform X4 [Durio zibethinus]|uniref:Bifunctional lysine-specific demethylase and histidyl-hydroxylase n=1 Tax=Durio zibethinus TaxID=66656 RepID=A0A6P5WRN2_DURZI|nr:uncharacterized protein LOC111276700 isoform X4 [Durio zibethinus]
MKQIKFHEKIEKFSFVSLAFPPVVFTWLPSSHLGSRRNLNLAEMEAKEEKEKERNSGKRKRRGFSPSHSDGNTVIFPLLLAAALSRSNTHTTLVKKCLTKFLSHGQPIPTPFLSLCPLLLNSKSPQIAILTARILGAASLMSFQMNQQVVSDSPTLKALISLMPPSHKNMIVSMAACDALLDLCSTCVARHRLLHFSALETLMFAFLQVRRSSILISLGTGDDVNIASLRIVFQRGELPVLLLSAAIILINTCNIEQLRKIPSKLSECFSVFLKEVWKEAHKQMLKGNILGPGQGMSLYFSSVTINNLAESIFRLSINVDQFPALMPSEMVKRRIFCFSEDDFKRFILSQWEVLPCVVRRFSTASLEAEEIFASLMQTLCSKEFFPSALSSILQGLTSCLPIDSDELDILSFLTEVRNKLGCPLINEQDIRVLRTDNQLKQEVRFFEENVDSCFVKAPQILCADDILKFEEAYNKGYTIALRGMEFRFENFALIADGLASVFGQPSAGDVLYIPRGFPHEACTHYSSPDGSAGLSLHLTLGIEVEPPFEWEGFMQVALFYWNHTQHQHHLSLKSLSGILNAMSVKLLHIVIGLISDSDPTFRKACLVAAASLESDANNWLDLCQKTIFSNLIEKINRESRFLEALKSVEVAIQRNEDPFQRIRWLRSLNQEGESVEGCEWVVAPSGVQDIFRLYVEYKEMAETVFMEVKSKFCSQVSYDHVTTVYRILHEKYKKARKQYMNGMHSLHYV